MCKRLFRDRRILSIALTLALFALLFACSADEGATGGPQNQGIPCGDDRDCPMGETCQDGACAPEIDGDGVPNQDGDTWTGECRVDDDCDSGFICDDNFCIPGQRPDGDQIADGDQVVDGDEVTDGDAGGSENEGKPCRNHSDCNDGLFCNGVETCGSDHTCISAQPPCNDNIPCTDDICDEQTNQCRVSAVDERCSDDDPCNGTEYCDTQLGCQSANPPSCDDGIACTTDTCVTMSGCVNEPNHAACADDNECTVDLCVVEDGGCSSSPDNALCNDGVECTVDECGAEGCTYTPYDQACNDGFSCTVDTCRLEGDCENVPDHEACAAEEVCDPERAEEGSDTGCAPKPQCDDDTDCDDGNYCNGLERCVDLLCVPGTAPDCGDDVDCTEDTCDEVNDTCVSTPVDRNCSDNDACNGIETCDLTEGCQPGEAPQCEDNITCTEDSCNPERGCVYSPRHDMCDDGQTCTANVCDPVEGCKNPPDNSACDDGVNCTTDTCNPETGCVNTPNDAYCNDGIACTSESCTMQNGCVYETHNDRCDDTIDCTANICTEGKGCEYPPDNSKCPGDQVCEPGLGCREPPECETDAHCSDNDLCNGVEICVAGDCHFGTPLNCTERLTGNHDSAACIPETGCSFSCTGDYKDCNGDLGLASGNGCESLLGTIQNCKSCGDTCSAPANATPVCTSDGCDWTCPNGFDCLDRCTTIVPLQFQVEHTGNTCTQGVNALTYYNCGSNGTTNGPAKEIIFTWVADRTDEVVIAVESTSGWDPILVALNSPCYGNCAIFSDDPDDSSSPEGFYLTPPYVGYTYYFALDGYWSTSCGTFRIGVAYEENVDCNHSGSAHWPTFLLVLLALGGCWLWVRRRVRGY